MNLVSRAAFVTMVLGLLFAQCVTAQQYGKIPDSQRPPTSMTLQPASSHFQQHTPAFHPPMASPPIEFGGKGVFVGTMINAYTSQGIWSNQLGYDFANEVVTVIYRSGTTNPDQGNGALVLNTTTNGGDSWSGESGIFNDDLRSNLPDYELSARHPSIYSMDIEGTTHIATLWANPYATLLHSNGVYGETCSKAGPLGGPYVATKLPKDQIMEFFPTKMTSDKNGVLYSSFQAISIDQDTPTGDFYVMKSTDNGEHWTFDVNTPAVSESALEDNYQIYSSSMVLDVSPDGSTLYLGFMGIFVDQATNTFKFLDNRFGYVRSTDGGATWSDPVMYPFYTWDMGDISVNTIDGFIWPSIAVAVDGLDKPHFLVAINGNDTFYPLDSMFIGELNINPDDPSEPPTFYALAYDKLPDYRRFINPAGTQDPPQPTFTIWNEPDFAKTPDGMTLLAKWIDADSLFVFNASVAANSSNSFTRDSTHDIYILKKDVNQESNSSLGWAVNASTGMHDIINVTNTHLYDEKFTKMSPRIKPDVTNPRVYFLYTIMATGEFVTGQIYPDTDDQGPAELYMVAWDKLTSTVGVNDPPNALPEGFTLTQNYPNPFNPTTTVQFAIPHAGIAKVRVYNMLGKEVATAYEGFTEAGSHSVQFNASNLPSGQYMYRLDANGYTTSKIMTLMK